MIFVVDFCYPLCYVQKTGFLIHCYILILFKISLFLLYIMNDKVVTYVKYFFEKILFFQSIYITSSKLNYKSNELNQYQGFTVENIHSYATLWFYCFKIEYDIIEEFETKGQIQNFYTETTSTFKFWVICILYWPTTPFFVSPTICVICSSLTFFLSSHKFRLPMTELRSFWIHESTAQMFALQILRAWKQKLK